MQVPPKPPAKPPGVESPPYLLVTFWQMSPALWALPTGFPVWLQLSEEL